MLYTKSIYAPREADDGVRILVTRYHPRGIKREHYDYWLRELAPSAGLLQLYKQGHVTPEEYSIEYQITISNDAARLAIHKLKQDVNTKNVTLLCYEPEGEFCHRNILKELILTGCFEPKDTNHHE